MTKLKVTNITNWISATVLYNSLHGKFCHKTKKVICFYNGKWMPNEDAKKLIFEGNELQNSNIHSKENPDKKNAWLLN